MLYSIRDIIQRVYRLWKSKQCNQARLEITEIRIRGWLFISAFDALRTAQFAKYYEELLVKPATMLRDYCICIYVTGIFQGKHIGRSQDTGYLCDLTKSLKNITLITVKQRSLWMHPLPPPSRTLASTSLVSQAETLIILRNKRLEFPYVSFALPHLKMFQGWTMLDNNSWR